jgi:hypothetical protein
LSVAPQNRRSEVCAVYALRSSGLLGVKASLTWVSQSGLKTGGGATAGRTCGTIAEVASETSYRWTDRCDGLRQTLLPCLSAFSVLGPRGIVVI